MEDINVCLRETLDAQAAVQLSCSTSHGATAKPFSYCCIFKASNNSSLCREEIFKLAGVYIQAKNKANKVDFDKPDYVVLIHVVCNICFISFVVDYFEYRKYNLIEQGNKFNSKAAVKPPDSAVTATSNPPEAEASEENEEDSRGSSNVNNEDNTQNEDLNKEDAGKSEKAEDPEKSVSEENTGGIRLI